jgi:hypothetical protein
LNFTRTSETVRRPAETPLPPYNEQLTRRSRYAATSYRWRRERACCGDRGGRVTAAIRRFIDGWSDRCEPFTWTKPADKILAKAIRKETSLT